MQNDQSADAPLPLKDLLIDVDSTLRATRDILRENRHVESLRLQTDPNERAPNGGWFGETILNVRKFAAACGLTLPALDDEKAFDVPVETVSLGEIGLEEFSRPIGVSIKDVSPTGGLAAIRARAAAPAIADIGSAAHVNAINFACLDRAELLKLLDSALDQTAVLRDPPPHDAASAKAKGFAGFCTRMGWGVTKPCVDCDCELSKTDPTIDDDAIDAVLARARASMSNPGWGAAPLLSDLVATIEALRPPTPGEEYGSPIKRWPFVESPGAFSQRLEQSLIASLVSTEGLYAPAILAAVRSVLIENPPVLADWALDVLTASREAAGRAQSDEDILELAKRLRALSRVYEKTFVRVDFELIVDAATALENASALAWVKETSAQNVFDAAIAGTPTIEEIRNLLTAWIKSNEKPHPRPSWAILSVMEAEIDRLAFELEQAKKPQGNQSILVSHKQKYQIAECSAGWVFIDGALRVVSELRRDEPREFVKGARDLRSDLDYLSQADAHSDEGPLGEGAARSILKIARYWIDQLVSRRDELDGALARASTWTFECKELLRELVPSLGKKGEFTLKDLRHELEDRAAAHDRRVSELLAANNAEVERRRVAERTLAGAITLSPLEIVDGCGTVAKINFEPGEYAVGIREGWILEDAFELVPTELLERFRKGGR